MSCPCCAPYPFAEPEVEPDVENAIEDAIEVPLAPLAEVNAVFGLLDLADNEEVEDHLRIDAYKAVLAHLKPEIF